MLRRCLRRNLDGALAANMWAIVVFFAWPFRVVPQLFQQRLCFEGASRSLDGALAAKMCATVVFLLGPFAHPLPSPGGRHHFKATLTLETAVGASQRHVEAKTSQSKPFQRHFYGETSQVDRELR